MALSSLPPARRSLIVLACVAWLGAGGVARADMSWPDNDCKPGPGDCAELDYTCDGFDDDCDGAPDEDFGSTSYCGEGACWAEGRTTCVNGVVYDSCVALEPEKPGVDDTCDRIDDDCDGEKDEDFPLTLRCGVGKCMETSKATCKDGERKDEECVPGEPDPDDSVCNGIDDDCDQPESCALESSEECAEATDEDYEPHEVECGVGACTRLGITRCENGEELDNCIAAEPSGVDDNCNGSVDDDCEPPPECQAESSAKCDALIDAYKPHETECGEGVCARTGTTRCESGHVQDSCVVGMPAGADNNCNGVDEDCSGSPDDNFPGRSFECGCDSGFEYCADGHVVQTCSPAPRSKCCDCPNGDCWGDPHLVTLDGLGYDFQQVGEYVLLSDGGDFVVQVRLAPYRGSSTVTSTQAVAMNVAGDRVGLYHGASTPLLVNGIEAAVPTAGLDLPNGGRIVRSNNTYTVTWPGEHVATIRMSDLLSTKIRIGDRDLTYSGLLGHPDGVRQNDLVTRAGQAVPWPYTREQIYGPFGDSWRITDTESLFDYAPGQSTATFTDDAYPSHIVTAQTLPAAQYKQALDACAAAGVAEPTQLEGCILDVASTDGDTSLASAAADAEPKVPVETVTFNGYYQSFEGSDDGRWSPSPRYVMPPLDVLVQTQTLGLVQGGQSITLTVTGLPAHSDVSVAFDTHIVGPWAGDTFTAAADGAPFTTTTFSNTAATQTFPGQLLDAEQPAQTGALAAGQMSGVARAIYHHSYNFAHTASSVTVTFTAPILPSGASFALDNVAVVTGVVGDPWDPKCGPGSASLDDLNPCTIDQCDPAVGPIHTPRPAGTSCSDNDLCNGSEACNATGTCLRTPLPTTDNSACTADYCDPVFGVIHDPLPLGATCSDGVLCNGAETCDGLGACSAGTQPEPSSLPPDTACNGADDDCDGVIDDDATCNDEDVCTTDVCYAGHCEYTNIVCNDGDQCTADSCDAALGCGTVIVAGLPCTDGDVCTTGEHCSGAGACQGGLPAAVSDGIGCTTDSCEQVSQLVVHTPEHALCDDGDVCNGLETCSLTLDCVPGTPLDVDDGNPCTDDGCDPTLGATHTPRAAGSICGLGEVCDGFGTCVFAQCPEQGATRVLACGINNRGSLSQLCNGGAWSNTSSCDDPDQCTDGDAQQVACGTTVYGSQAQQCVLGSWTNQGGCTCADGTVDESGDGSVCAGFTQVSVGGSHTCAVTDGGRVYCWGDNASGQLGDGTTTPRLVPVRVGTDSDWDEVSTRGAHSCGLRAGKVYCWGNNALGQLGDGTSTQRLTPVRVGTDTDWSQVSVGGGQTCGVRSGLARCWGNNANGQLGDGTTTNRNTPTAVGTANNWTYIVAGGGMSCGRRGGALYCWGNNAAYQLGDGTNVQRNTPVQVGSATDWSGEIAAGSDVTCATRAGALYCWGSSAYGAIGDGGTGARPTPTRIGTATDWDGISNLLGTSCGLRAGQLYCWGDNAFGGFGNGTNIGSMVPVPSGGELVWESMDYGAGGAACGITAGRLYCWGANPSGQLGNGSTANALSPVQVGNASAWQSVTTGGTHTCAIVAGSLYCWGDNTYGGIGNGDSGALHGVTAPLQIGAATDWQSVVAGRYHTCGIRSGELYCWGYNALGGVGDGTTTDKLEPTRIGAASDWQAVVAGEAHSCGLRAGALYCWGRNSDGAVGIGSTLTQTSPVRVGTASDWVTATAGPSHNCGIRSSTGPGSLYCWGDNTGGQLGDNSRSDRTVPTQVGTATNWSRVAGGYQHSCGVRAGTLYCWGENNSYELGLGDQTDRLTPAQVGTATNWTGIASHWTHSCGLRLGNLHCWGLNTSGQLGDGTITVRTTPVQVDTSGAWTQAATGFNYSCGIKQSSLYCWGSNSSPATSPSGSVFTGQLGTGDTWTPEPVAVP